MKGSANTFLFCVLIALLFSSCVSTRVEASPYQDSMENLECRTKSDWSYFWGLKQKRVDSNPENTETVCPCREGAMSWVVVKSSFTDFLLSLVTLGTVNHRTASYGCARPQNGEGDLNN
jgi:PBP1b-binding outer membrane lipoprotein LpoB